MKAISLEGLTSLKSQSKKDIEKEGEGGRANDRLIMPNIEKHLSSVREQQGFFLIHRISCKKEPCEFMNLLYSLKSFKNVSIMQPRENTKPCGTFNFVWGMQSALKACFKMKH